ncbi:MAG: hypothetical protein ACXQTP_04900, partial [Candidatus Methanofastidiosia archaeon]
MKKFIIAISVAMIFSATISVVLAGYPVSNRESFNNVWGNGYAEVKGVWELNDYITDIRYPWNFASPYQHWR